MPADRRRPVDDDPLPPVERFVSRGLEDQRGRELSARTRQAERTLETYLAGGIRPRWMERLVDVEAGIAAATRRLDREYRRLQQASSRDPVAFASQWRATAEAFRADELNALIRQHNEWYPIERDLPMDVRTGDYVKVAGRSYRRPVLDTAWVLEQWPAEPGQPGASSP